MADHAAINEMRTGACGLRLPMQAAPINRTPAGAALAVGSGIEASAWWNTALDIMGKAAPIIASFL